MYLSLHVKVKVCNGNAAPCRILIHHGYYFLTSNTFCPPRFGADIDIDMIAGSSVCLCRHYKHSVWKSGRVLRRSDTQSSRPSPKTTCGRTEYWVNIYNISILFPSVKVQAPANISRSTVKILMLRAHYSCSNIGLPNDPCPRQTVWSTLAACAKIMWKAA